MKNMLASKSLYVYGENSPVVDIKVFMPEEYEPGVYHCWYKVEIKGKEPVEGFNQSSDTLIAVLGSLAQLGATIAQISSEDFENGLRQLPEEENLVIENCGFPYFTVDGYKFPKLLDK